MAEARIHLSIEILIREVDLSREVDIMTEEVVQWVYQLMATKPLIIMIHMEQGLDQDILVDGAKISSNNQLILGLDFYVVKVI